jgi:hypothetical protein
MKGTKTNNAVGVKGKSGRKARHVEMNYFKKLDAMLPEVLDFLIKIVRDGAKNMEDKQKMDFALKASKIMNDKAPQRVQGSGDTGEFVFKVIGGTYDL